MERIEIQIARKFHKVYEKLAPEFGYTTRPETRERKKMPDKYMKYLAKVIAMGVRNNMEDFHVKNLSDAQMKELNPLVRDAIYTVLVMINEESDKYHSELRWLTRMIPEYWEDPKFIKSIL